MKRIVKLLAVACLNTAPAFQANAQQTFPAFPPTEVDNAMDFNQMLHQMRLTLPDLPSRRDDPNRPDGSVPVDPQNPNGSWSYGGHRLNRSAWGLWDNYDDTSGGFFAGRDSFRVGQYTPIPLLKMRNGEDVASVEEWREKRRPEIARDVQQYLYGFFPSADRMPGVKFSVTESGGGKGNNRYVQKELTGVIDISGYPEVRNRPVISATLRTPASATGPVPVMIVIGGFGNTLDRYWDIVSPHGWGVCIFIPNTVQPDNGAGLTSYLIGLVNRGNWRKPDDWGAIGAWTWGIGRLIDFLETDPAVNGKAIGLTGHSRYGKATLFAAAFDERIAIAFPSDAGSLGTKMNRRHWGQDLENSGSPSEYHWMAGSFLQWCGERTPGRYLPRKVEECPVDAHSLFALCAPRPVFVNGGTQSQWSDPYGMYLSLLHATPVYELLGVEGLVIRDSKPRTDVGYLEGTLGYRLHDGGHTDAPDWPAFFEFAAKFIEATELDTSTGSVTLPADGKPVTLEIRSNRGWKIRNGASWLLLNESAGSDNGRVEISSGENTTGKGRSSELEIEAAGKKLHIPVVQASENGEISLSAEELTLAGNGESSASLDIASETAWSIASVNDWIRFDPEVGVNSRRIPIEALPNPLVEQRSTVLTVSSPAGNRQVTVTQDKGVPVLQIQGSASIRFGAEASTNSSVFVVTNTVCTVESPVDWISGEVSRQGMFSRLFVNVTENTARQPRSAKIAIRAEGLDPVFVEVTQH